MRTSDTQVLIVGAGPCGLMLANELGRRGIATARAALAAHRPAAPAKRSAA